MQLDTRVGWRFRVGQGNTLDLTADVINLTNRANFVVIRPIAAARTSCC
jgi:hypothetical protein